MAALTAASSGIAALRISQCSPNTTVSLSCSTSSSFSSFSGLSCERNFHSARTSRGVCQGSHERAVLVVEAVDAPRKDRRKARQTRIRKKLTGTTERPRLAVFRSNKHIYAQVIDDTQSQTLAAASTLLPALREELQLTAGPTIDAARRVGMEVAKMALEKGVTKVSFDRGGYIYHGRIAALADGAREGGLEF